MGFFYFKRSKVKEINILSNYRMTSILRAEWEEVRGGTYHRLYQKIIAVTEKEVPITFYKVLVKSCIESFIKFWTFFFFF